METGQVDYNQYICPQGSVACLEGAVLFYDSTNSRLWFQDTDLAAPPALLCVRAECGHNDDTCSGRVESLGVYAYENQICYVSQSDGCIIGLYRMDKNGTGRVKLKELNMLDESGSCSFGYSYTMYDGCLLLNLAKQEGLKQTVTLYRIPLEENPELTVLYTDDTGTVEIGCNTYAQDGWVFYPLWQDGKCTLWACCVATGESKPLVENWAIRSAMKVEGDKLFWCTFNDGLYQTDLATGETEQIFALPHITDLGKEAFDDRYLYITNAWEADGGLSIYDMEGRQLRFLSFDGLEDSLVYRISTQDKVFFGYTAGRGPDGGVGLVCYLDKAAIADGTAEFIFLDTDN